MPSFPAGHSAIFSLRLVIVITALFASTHAQADCPENTVQCDGVVSTSFAPRYSVRCAGEIHGPGPASASYDLESGLLATSCAGTTLGASSTVDALDDFAVQGMAPGIPVSFQAELHLTVSYLPTGVGANGTVEIFLRNSEGLGPFLNRNFHTAATFDTVVVLPLQRAAGEQFLLYEHLISAAISAKQDAMVQLEFTHLPVGASIVSCQGFRMGGPVPGLMGTWGRVRAIYR